MGIHSVRVTGGVISGTALVGRRAGVTVFRGVPYAASPVGPLRWAAPVDPEPWDGVRTCVVPGHAPVQAFLSDRHAREYYTGGFPASSEDCLSLNVATAAADPDERRPVYVFFHGGGLTNCFAHEPQLDPSGLAAKGVVVVTVGQRLNVFGHLALPQLTDEGLVSGNYGLLDQLKAMEWIARNIAGFGGDPDRITVGGQSGGCIKATAMAIAAPTRGTVRGVVNQSGNKWTHRFSEPDEAHAFGRRYLEFASIDPETSVEELRAMPVERIFRAAPKGVMPDHMVRDGSVLQDALMADGLVAHARGVRFLNGNNLGETNLASASQQLRPGGPVPLDLSTPVDSVAAFRTHFRTLLGNRYDSAGLAEVEPTSDQDALGIARRLGAYGLAGAEFNNSARSVGLNLLVGELLAAQQASVSFTYLWSHLLPTPPGPVDPDRDPTTVAAWHSSELWFTFGSLAEGTPAFRPWREVDHALAHQTTSYFANFIADGDPNGDGLPEWTPSDARRGWMEFTDEPEPHLGFGVLDTTVDEFTRAEYGVPRIEPVGA